MVRPKSGKHNQSNSNNLDRPNKLTAIASFCLNVVRRWNFSALLVLGYRLSASPGQFFCTGKQMDFSTFLHSRRKVLPKKTLFLFRRFLSCRYFSRVCVILVRPSLNSAQIL